MANKQAFPAIQGDDAFVIAPSDSADLVADTTNNTKGYALCFVHNRSAGGDVKVTTVNGTDITIYIAQGQVFPLAVKKVWATPAPPANLVGITGKISS